MGRGLRAFHNTPVQPGGLYSVVLEQRGHGEALLFENYAVGSLGKAKFFKFAKCKIVNF